MSKSSLPAKIKGFASDVRAHWKTPKPGRYVSYREYLDIFAE